MGVIWHEFNLRDYSLSYPSNEEIVSMLEKRTHLQVYLKVTKHIKKYKSGEEREMITTVIESSNEIYEVIGLKNFGNHFILSKSYPNFTYIFYSLVHLLTELTIEKGGGSLTLSFLSDDDIIKPLDTFQDLTDFFRERNRPLLELEFAKYPYEIASKMEGFPDYDELFKKYR